MKVLYLHIPKTGGTSITSVLSKYESNVITERHPIYKTSPKYSELFPEVLNFRISRAKHFEIAIGKETYDNTWKVALVRNPWDRYVSNWKWLTRKEKSNPNKGWSQRGWKGENGLVSFESFVKQMYWCYEEVNMHPYQHDKWHIRNQIEHIIDLDGNLIVDHIGRFENIQEEFNLICQKSELDLELPHLNRVGHYSGEPVESDPVNIHYSEYYNQELIDIVAERCKVDIEEFKYDYEEKK